MVHKRADAVPAATPIRRSVQQSADAALFERLQERQALSATGELHTRRRDAADAGWKLILREGECVRIRLAVQDRLGRPELMRNVDEVEALPRKMMRLNPRITSFISVIGPQRQIDRKRLENAVRYGFVLVR